MSEYSTTKQGYDKKNLSDKQKALIDNLNKSEDGDVIQCAKDAGYANPYQAVRQNAELIKDAVEDELLKLSSESIKTLGKILRSSAGVPQASEKLKAIAMILERTNPKTDNINVNGQVKASLFILPNKQPLDEDDGESS